MDYKITYKLPDSQEVGGTTAGKIRAAAASCSTANTTLRTLFPQVFEKDDKSVEIPPGNAGPESFTLPVCSLGSPLLRRRTAGPLAGKALILNSRFDWRIETDGEGFLVLIPTKK